MIDSILSEFPTEFGDFPASFDSNGVLPLGDYAPTREQFEARFVDIGDIDRRRSIYDGWNRHREALLLAGVPNRGRQLLNGSFATNKHSPGDIDIAVEIPIDEEALFSLTKDHPIGKLLQGPLMKHDYHCDAYPIYSLPLSSSQYYNVTVGAIKYWTKWFGYTRNATPKGRVWTTTGGLK